MAYFVFFLFIINNNMWLIDVFGSLATMLYMIVTFQTRKHHEVKKFLCNLLFSIYFIYYKLYPIMVQFMLCAIYNLVMVKNQYNIEYPSVTFYNKSFEEKQTETDNISLEIIPLSQEPLVVQPSQEQLVVQPSEESLVVPPSEESPSQEPLVVPPSEEQLVVQPSEESPSQEQLVVQPSEESLLVQPSQEQLVVQPSEKPTTQSL